MRLPLGDKILITLIYRSIWIKHQREYKHASDEAIRRILDRYTENTGKRVEIPESEELIIPEPQGASFYTHFTREKRQSRV